MANKNSEVNNLSPDGFSRFFMLADILRDAYKGATRKIQILDVGGGSEFMQQVLDTIAVPYELTILDIIERPKKIKATYIQGDATKMNFSDSSFDVVLSTDVLEHVVSEGKQAFLDECLRVSKSLCIIAAPFDTPGVTAAEVVVNEFNKKQFGVGQAWLEEHLKYGKPTMNMFIDTLRKNKIQYFEFGTQNITTWLLNTHLNLIEAKIGLGNKRHSMVNQYYNKNILEMNEFSGPTYRHFFVMFLDPSLERNVSVEKYTNNSINYDKTAKYTNMLMDLIADRITKLTQEKQVFETIISNLHEEIKKHEYRESDLHNIIEKQEYILDKLEPLLRVAKIPVIKKAYALLGKQKEKT